MECGIWMFDDVWLGCVRMIWILGFVGMCRRPRRRRLRGLGKLALAAAAAGGFVYNFHQVIQARRLVSRNFQNRLVDFPGLLDLRLLVIRSFRARVPQRS